MVFFERFEQLARQNNTSPNAVAKELGISSGSVTAWKNGTAPSIDKAVQIATFFDVTTDYLLGREKPTASESGPPIDLKIEALLREIQGLNEEDAAKVQEYIRFVKQQRT